MMESNLAKGSERPCLAVIVAYDDAAVARRACALVSRDRRMAGVCADHR